ncbi:MAG TPA: hypothetical protein VH062_17865 [Polyangiaceae bacterium]|jgi:hypothetical protein|nr:hypothetical protein [Polyangiaceae bacterium]
MRRPQSYTSALIASGLTILVMLTTVEARAEGIIKNPGDHPKYDVELEPHALLDWDNYWWGGAGYGIGMHAVIPFLDNGPVRTINNNMGIGFGLNWSHFSDNGCGWAVNVRGDRLIGACNVSANAIKLPVYVQWNFFFTKVVGVFGEAGFGIYHDWASYGPQGGCPVGVNCTVNSTGAFPYFEGGGRFLFGDTVGLLVRVGFPYLTVGASFLL